MYRGYATALLDCNGKEIAKHGIYEGKRKAECLKWWKSQPVADEASKMQNGHDSQEDANEPAQETRAEHRTDGKQIQISRLKHSIQKNVNGATRSKQRFHICGTCLRNVVVAITKLFQSLTCATRNSDVAPSCDVIITGSPIRVVTRQWSSSPGG
mmetsp:Transcript_4973/g.10077  ORF Transcript_4973/g.10077 Transcript_4973/m.10077 type:complete len:155 (-) Transcript_4973:409-873(-)